MKINLEIESGRLTKKTKLICFGCFILVVTAMIVGISLNNYNKNVRKAREVVEAFGSKEDVREVLINIDVAAKDANVRFEEMADYMMKMGEKFGYLGLTSETVARNLKMLELNEK